MKAASAWKRQAVFFHLVRGRATAEGIDLAAGVALGARGSAGRRSRCRSLIRLAAARGVDLAAGTAPGAGQKILQGGKEAGRSRSFHPAPLARVPIPVSRSQSEGRTGRSSEKKKTDDTLLDPAHGTHLSRDAPRRPPLAIGRPCTR